MGRIFDREAQGLKEKGTLLAKQKQVVSLPLNIILQVLNRVVLCWRFNFNSFCTPLPVTFMSHRAYDKV